MEEYTSLTIRKRPLATKQGLRLRAAQHGHFMEKGARLIFKDAINNVLPLPR